MGRPPEWLTLQAIRSASRPTAGRRREGDGHVGFHRRDAVRDVAVIVTMVSDNDAATAVWLDPEHGALAAAMPGAIAIESSTITPDTVKRIGEEAARSDIRFVEAPVVGSRPQAEAGALFYLLAGDPTDIDEAQPYVDINAGNSTRVGSIGNAATLKLAINGLFAAQVAAYAEIAGFIERSDLDTPVAFEILKALPITSPGLQRSETESHQFSS